MSNTDFPVPAETAKAPKVALLVLFKLLSLKLDTLRVLKIMKQSMALTQKLTFSHGVDHL